MWETGRYSMGLLECATACLVNLIDPLSDMIFWLWSKKILELVG